MKLTKPMLSKFLNTNSRDALALKPRSATETDTTFCGGYPTLPTPLAWPLDPNGNECIFLAQIDLADLPIKPEDWPDSGVLFVFLNSALEDCGDLPTSEPFLYYATADQELKQRKPSSPIASTDYFWYTGDGVDASVGNGNSSLKLDALPKSAWNFLRFSDHNYPPDIKDYGRKRLIRRSEREALKYISASPTDIALKVEQYRQENRPEISENSSEPPYFGGFEYIDPNFKLRATWWGRPTVYEKTNVPIHPYFADWPSTAKVIFYHAKEISFLGKFGADRDNSIDPLARRIAAEAEEWVIWAKEFGSSDVPSPEKEQYRAWCQSAFTQCFEMARPKLLDAPRVTKSLAKYRKRLYQLLPSVWRKQREAIRLAHSRRLKAIEGMYTPTHKAIGNPEGNGTPDQLFGYGENIQFEADNHRIKTLVLQSWGYPNIDFGDGNFKLWLATKHLKPNAWQRVVAINAIA